MPDRAAYGRILMGRLPIKWGELDHYFCLLHEMGHYACRHYGLNRTQLEVLRDEIQAWQYALRCVQPKHHFKAKGILLKSLRGYFQKTTSKVSDQEILNMCGYEGD